MNAHLHLRHCPIPQSIPNRRRPLQLPSSQRQGQTVYLASFRRTSIPTAPMPRRLSRALTISPILLRTRLSRSTGRQRTLIAYRRHTTQRSKLHHISHHQQKIRLQQQRGTAVTPQLQAHDPEHPCPTWRLTTCSQRRRRTKTTTQTSTPTSPTKSSSHHRQSTTVTRTSRRLRQHPTAASKQTYTPVKTARPNQQPSNTNRPPSTPTTCPIFFSKPTPTYPFSTRHPTLAHNTVQAATHMTQHQYQEIRQRPTFCYPSPALKAGFHHLYYG